MTLLRLWAIAPDRLASLLAPNPAESERLRRVAHERLPLDAPRRRPTLLDLAGPIGRDVGPLVRTPDEATEQDVEDLLRGHVVPGRAPAAWQLIGHWLDATADAHAVVRVRRQPEVRLAPVPLPVPAPAGSRVGWLAPEDLSRLAPDALRGRRDDVLAMLG